MFSFKSLHCCHCNAVILNLPESELDKLSGLNFQCECCGHQNLLSESRFYKSTEKDPFISTFSFESLLTI